MTADMSAAWVIDVDTHIVRAPDYRGKKIEAGKQKIRLAFDGFTIPGILFAVPCLMTASCALFPFADVTSSFKLRPCRFFKFAVARLSCRRDASLPWRS